MKTPWYMQQKIPVVLVAGLGGLFTVVDIACAQPWAATTAPDRAWKALASSADGTKLVAAADNRRQLGPYSIDGPPAPIYVSADAGATWTQTSAPSNAWSSVASSADGTKLVAAAEFDGDWNGTNYGNGLIYTSTNSGATWTPTIAPSEYWSAVASSADGAKLVATANLDSDGLIYTSSDSGATWTPTSAPSNSWSSVASSEDGAKLVAVATAFDGGDGLIYTSGDWGTTWTPTSAPSNNWSCIASSGDGTKLVAGAYGEGDGSIYTSSDSGATWTRTSAPTDSWRSVASSADGNKLVAMGGGWSRSWESIYISTDSGATWTTAGEPAASGWNVVASSADGSNIVAVGSAICTLRSPAPAPPLPPSPQLAVGFSGATLGLSWLVPSTRFVLQQNSELGSTNWVEVPTPPTLDFTNLHHRVTLTPSLGSSYFRLKQQ